MFLHCLIVQLFHCSIAIFHIIPILQWLMPMLYRHIGTGYENSIIKLDYIECPICISCISTIEQFDKNSNGFAFAISIIEQITGFSCKHYLIIASYLVIFAGSISFKILYTRLFSSG